MLEEGRCEACEGVVLPEPSELSHTEYQAGDAGTWEHSQPGVVQEANGDDAREPTVPYFPAEPPAFRP